MLAYQPPTSDAPSREEIARLRKLARNFWLFAITCLFTFDENEKDSRSKLKKPFPRYGYLKRIADALVSERRVVILKPRQMLVSWVVVAFAVWTVLFRKGERVLVVSKRQEDAYHLKERAAALFENLPPVISSRLVRIVEDNKSVITLAGGSSIHFLPASPSIGRTFTASLVILDEAAFHPWAEEIYTSLVPTLSGGGRLVLLSTPNGVGGTFHTVWVNAEERGFHRVEIDWREHPDRNEAWYRDTTAPLSSRKIAQEYERDFIQSGAAVFDQAYLKARPIPTRDELREWRKVARERLDSAPFLIGIDVGEGHPESDNSVVSVIHKASGREIKTFAAKLRPDVFAKKIAPILDRYPGPIGVEKNGPGGALIRELVRIGYGARLYKHREFDDRGNGRSRVGWVTSTKSKPIMVDELEAALRKGDVSVSDADLLAELLVYEYKDTLAHSGAPEGYKDDRVVALAIAWQMRGSAGRGARNVERGD